MEICIESELEKIFALIDEATELKMEFCLGHLFEERNDLIDMLYMLSI